MAMSLFLATLPHAAFAQASSLAITRVFTTDANNVEKTSFAPGNAVRYYVNINNTSGASIRAMLMLMTAGPVGPNARPIYFCWDIGTYKPGAGQASCIQNSTIPTNAIAGKYEIFVAMKPTTEGSSPVTGSGTLTVT